MYPYRKNIILFTKDFTASEHYQEEYFLDAW